MSGSSYESSHNCGIRLQGLDDKVGDLGLELAPQFWDRGFATEAARRMLSFAFGDLGVQEVRGLSVTENARLARLVGRLGFTNVGSRSGPDWLQRRGWSQTEWRLAASEWTVERVG